MQLPSLWHSDRIRPNTDQGLLQLKRVSDFTRHNTGIQVHWASVGAVSHRPRWKVLGRQLIKSAGRSWRRAQSLEVAGSGVGAEADKKKPGDEEVPAHAAGSPALFRPQYECNSEGETAG